MLYDIILYFASSLRAQSACNAADILCRNNNSPTTTTKTTTTETHEQQQQQKRMNNNNNNKNIHRDNNSKQQNKQPIYSPLCIPPLFSNLQLQPIKINNISSFAVCVLSVCSLLSSLFCTTTVRKRNHTNAKVNTNTNTY